jgi:hypothetical protein
MQQLLPIESTQAITISLEDILIEETGIVLWASPLAE